MLRQRVWFFSLVVLSLFSGLTYAQAVSDQEIETATSLQEDAFRLNQNRLNDFNKTIESEKNRRPKVIIDIPQLEITSQNRKDLPQFFIHEIVVTGNIQLRSYCISQITRAYTNQSLNQDDISVLLKKITNLYLENGFITSRATLPPQNLQSGVLRIGIVEGRVSDVLFDDSTQPNRLIRFAFPIGTGDVLNIKDIDQGVEQLNRVGTGFATMQLIPDPVAPGQTLIQIHRQSSAPYQLRMQYHYSQEMDLFPDQLVLIRDNVLAVNDSWQLSLVQDSGSEDKQSRSFSLSGSLPYGYLTFNGGLSQFDYSNVVSGNTTLFLSSGHTESIYGGVSAVVYRSPKRKLELGGKFSVQDTKSFIQDVENEAGSQTLSVMGLTASGESRGTWGIWNATVELSQGTSLFGATQDNGDTDVPQAQFRKYTLDISGYSPLRKSRFTLQNTIRAQYSPDILYGNEQFSIGDEYSVRGFDESSQGNSGALIRESIQFPVSALTPHRFKARCEQMGLEASVGTDAGIVWNSGEEDWKVGLGLGLSGRLRSGDWRVTWGIPIESNDPVPKTTSFYGHLTLKAF